MNVPIHDPHEEYNNVNFQVFGNEQTPTSEIPPTMGGFYQNFTTFFPTYPNQLPAEQEAQEQQIMQSYTPSELPVLNGLAKSFAVSDAYFSSVPTQTNCNRAFAACGNSIGINNDNQSEAFVNNGEIDWIPPHLSQSKRQFTQNTIWNVLTDNGFDSPSDWMHYYSKGIWTEGLIELVEELLGLEGYSYTRDLMQAIQPPSFDNHFTGMDNFYINAMAGTLPTFSFLEPEWGLETDFLNYDIGINGTDYHPPTNLAPGEAFVKSIYDALTFNINAWSETLFIINFDEHGGTYDHVATPWGASPPWANPADGTKKPELFEGDFKFDRFGVRVPLILVSPLVKESTVFRAEGSVPYDHTSVIATILNVMGIPKDKWNLGSRTANAPTFENVFTGNPVRTDIPKIDINKEGITSSSIKSNTLVNDIQLRMMKSLIDRAIKKKGLSIDKVQELSLETFKAGKTLAELSEKFVEILKILIKA